MLKKMGFTLAEVIITIAILGVIAAITLPALMANVEKPQYMNSLKVAQNMLTNGFAQMMAIEGVENIRDTELWSNCITDGNFDPLRNSCLPENLKKYFAINNIIYQGSPSSLKTYDIHKTETDLFAETFRYYFPNNIAANIVFFPNASMNKTSAECNNIKEMGGNMCGQAALIFIDVNGDKKPNAAGKDIYRFHLAPNGRLYPEGGLDVTLYESSSSGSDPISEPKWKTTCDGKPASSNCIGGTSLDLTGRVIDEGYRINYY